MSTVGTVASSRELKPGEWIGVDLDGTLAEYDRQYSIGKIGPPIPRMLARVKQWLADGKDVRIFTARISNPGFTLEREAEVQQNLWAIETWCLQHFGQRLPVTNIKDWKMHELWDDRAVRVIFNTGERADGLTG